jgi:beta-phosphoglucomutase family hydrolase
VNKILSLPLEITGTSKKKKMLKGVVFDMDGVLVDNMKVHQDAFAEIANRYGVEIDTDSIVAQAGKGNDEIFTALFPAEIIKRVGTKQLGEEKELIYREIYAPKLKATRGLVAFLESLKAAGIKIAVGTSAIRANMDFVLDGLGIRKYFDAVVNAGMVSHCKPDPEIYLVALRELSIEAGECLVFEDAVAGIQAAHAADISVVAIASTLPFATLETQPGVVLTVKDFSSITASTVKALV